MIKCIINIVMVSRISVISIIDRAGRVGRARRAGRARRVGRAWRRIGLVDIIVGCRYKVINSLPKFDLENI
jgi:hypothetical protein